MNKQTAFLIITDRTSPSLPFVYEKSCIHRSWKIIYLRLHQFQIEIY